VLRSNVTIVPSLLTARPQIVQRAGPPKLPANIRLGQVGVPQGHSQALVPQDLAQQFQVTSLPENARRGVMAQGVGSEFTWEPRANRQAMRCNGCVP
jgi:hypothetical protein